MIETLQQLEITAIIALQAAIPWLTAPLRLITFLGDEEFYLLIMPALYWCVNAGWGLRMGNMLLLSTGFNTFFKFLLHTPRPYWIDTGVTPALAEASFGAPSGHAMNAASVWGVLAACLRKSWTTVVMLVLIFLIGFSRIHLGVHFISDVLMGWLLGGLLLLSALRLEKPLVSWLLSKPNHQIGILLFASLAFIAFIVLPHWLLQSWALPPLWAQNALAAFPHDPIHPTDLGGAFTAGGTWFGMTAGAVWFYRRRGMLDASGSIWLRLVRYVLGILGVAVLWSGLGMIFPRGNDLLSYSLRFIRYALVGSWVSLFAPSLFVHLRLSGLTQKHHTD